MIAENQMVDTHSSRLKHLANFAHSLSPIVDGYGKIGNKFQIPVFTIFTNSTDSGENHVSYGDIGTHNVVSTTAAASNRNEVSLSGN